MNQLKIYPYIETITIIVLSILCYGEYFLSLNLYILFLYLLATSFLHYRSVQKSNIIHISWMAICAAFAISTENYYLEMIFVAIAPLTLVIELFKTAQQKIFRWIQAINVILFVVAIWLVIVGENKFAYILALTALLIRQAQFPFHLWIREMKQSPELYPSFLFFTVLQTGFIIYANSVLHIYNKGILSQFIPGLTMGTGLLLAIYGLKEKDCMTKHLLLIVSQSCLPLAAYHSFSTTTATGGLLFAMTIALGGTIYGMMAFHFYKQKQITTLDQYYSLYRSNKNLAAIYFVSGFSLVGLPFTIGYFAEDILFHGLIETATFLAPLYIIMTAINGYSVFVTFNKIFFGHTQKSWSMFYQSRYNKALIGLSTMLITFGVVAIGQFSHSIEERIERSHAELLKVSHHLEQVPKFDTNRDPSRSNILSHSGL